MLFSEENREIEHRHSAENVVPRASDEVPTKGRDEEVQNAGATGIEVDFFDGGWPDVVERLAETEDIIVYVQASEETPGAENGQSGPSVSEQVKGIIIELSWR